MNMSIVALLSTFSQQISFEKTEIAYMCIVVKSSTEHFHSS